MNDYTSQPGKYNTYNKNLNKTVQETSHKEILDIKFRDLLKSKLGYEWKNIFRILNNGD